MYLLSTISRSSPIEFPLTAQNFRTTPENNLKRWRLKSDLTSLSLSASILFSVPVVNAELYRRRPVSNRWRRAAWTSCTWLVWCPAPWTRSSGTRTTLSQVPLKKTSSSKKAPIAIRGLPRPHFLTTITTSLSLKSRPSSALKTTLRPSNVN